MYSLGITAVFMYLTSVVSFLLGVQYPNFYLFGFGIGAVFFIAATAILLAIFEKRADKQDF